MIVLIDKVITPRTLPKSVTFLQLPNQNDDYSIVGTQINHRTRKKEGGGKFNNYN